MNFPAQVGVQEKGINSHDATLAGIEHFSKEKLAATEVPEKGVNTHDATLAGVTNFNKVRRNMVIFLTLVTVFEKFKHELLCISSSLKWHYTVC